MKVRLCRMDSGEEIRSAVPEPMKNGGSLLRVGVTREDLERCSGGVLNLCFELEILDLHGFWQPELYRPVMHLEWGISFQSGLQRNFPYLTFFEQGGRNRAAFALTCLKDDVSVNAAMNQEFSRYDVVFSVAADASASPEGFDFLVSTEALPWQDLLSEYRSLVLKEGIPAFPESAWKPVYCTWYAVHAALSMEYLERNAELAADMGFGTFIVDDGWCFDRMKRVTPEELPDWYCDIGDWRVSENKLPGFREHVRRARERGLKYLLWVAPFFLGKNSRAFAEILNVAGGVEAGRLPCISGSVVMDPAEPAAARHAEESLLSLMKEWNLDGLKIDFLDTVRPSVTSPRSRVIAGYLERLITRIRGMKKDALIEFRQHYATPGMLPYATQFRAGDVPFDYLENIHRIAMIRLILGDSVPVHADPVYFHADETPMNVARHMIASLAGVPMFSMDLSCLKEDLRAVVKHWIAFYLAHLETFRNGHWSVEYFCDHLVRVAVAGEKEEVAILLDSARAEGEWMRLAGKGKKNSCGNGRKCFLLNLAEREFFSCPAEARVFDPSGRKMEPGTAVPCGGFAEIRF